MLTHKMELMMGRERGSL